MTTSLRERMKGTTHGLRLAWALGIRDLRNRYAASIGGAAWLVGLPLLYSLINIFVFSILMSGKMGDRYGDVPFALFYFSAFSVWTVFAEVTGRSTALLREYGYLINKIAFPIWVLPLIAFASALLTQAVVLLITAFLLFWYGHPPSVHLWVYPLVWLCTVAITMGFAYAVSSVSVYLPDMIQAVPVCITVLFFLTPILYPPALVEQGATGFARNVLMDWNPFYYLVEAARAALIGVGPFPWHYLAFAAAFAAVVLSSGFALFRKLQNGFADVL